MRQTVAALLVATMLVLAGCSTGGVDGNGASPGAGTTTESPTETTPVDGPSVDGPGVTDTPTTSTPERGGNGNGPGSSNTSGNGAAVEQTESMDASGDGGSTTYQSTSSRATDDTEIGLSVGGAQDATGFRTNVEEGYVPQPTDMTYEGLYHDYYFDTDQDRPCEELFCPSFSRAVTEDPLSDEREQYMTVGLNSGLSQADFERKDLNLVVVVDVSGSMDSQFDDYHYDGEGDPEVDPTQTKMSAAKDAVTTVFSHLEDRDQLGVVSFNNGAETVQQLQSVDEMDREALSQKIESLSAGGGTNLDAGMREASEMLEPYRNGNESESETRIIYVTDAMPNTGQIESGALGDRFRDNAENGVYTTFLGVGVDFNSELVEQITNVRGANYYSVHSPLEFDERMDEGFQYMVTPLVYDLSLEIANGSEAIEHVYGSGEDYADGAVIDVTTLFPSRTDGNRTEGGIVLLQLNESAAGTITLETSYETRAGERHNSTRTIDLDSREAPYYGSTGIRKAVALTRYATLMQNWAAFERVDEAGSTMEVVTGIEPQETDRSQWEQESVPLEVSEPYDDRIEAFESYFRSEAEALNATRFEDDLAVLETLTENAALTGE